MKTKLTSSEWGLKKKEIYRELKGELGQLLLFIERKRTTKFLVNHTLNQMANSVMYANYSVVKCAPGELRENEFPGVELRWQCMRRDKPIPKEALVPFGELQLDLPF